MPNKTIYVAAADLPMFDEAARRAGGLSPAIALALRQYLATPEGPTPQATSDDVELDVTDGSATVRTRFRGRRMARLGQRRDTREVTYEIYRTAKDQYALYTIDRPDWRRWAKDPRAREDPEAWEVGRREAGRSHGRTLDVFATADELLARLPHDVVDDARHALEEPGVRELDI